MEARLRAERPPEDDPEQPAAGDNDATDLNINQADSSQMDLLDQSRPIKKKKSRRDQPRQEDLQEDFGELEEPAPKKKKRSRPEDRNMEPDVDYQMEKAKKKRTKRVEE